MNLLLLRLNRILRVLMVKAGMNCISLFSRNVCSTEDRRNLAEKNGHYLAKLMSFHGLLKSLRFTDVLPDVSPSAVLQLQQQRTSPITFGLVLKTKHGRTYKRPLTAVIIAIHSSFGTAKLQSNSFEENPFCKRKSPWHWTRNFSVSEIHLTGHVGGGSLLLEPLHSQVS